CRSRARLGWSARPPSARYTRRARSPRRTSKVYRPARPFGVTLTRQEHRHLAFKPHTPTRLLTPDGCIGDTPAKMLVERGVLLRTENHSERRPQLYPDECRRLR